MAFSESAQSEILRLQEGDSLSVQGSAKVAIYQKDGQSRASLEVVANHVLALRQPPKPRKLSQQAADTRQLEPMFDDSIPF